MASFNIVVDHEFNREEVVSRLQDFSQHVLKEMPVEVTEITEEWDDQGNLTFGFKAMGFAVTGQMSTHQDKVVVIGKLPFAALPFRGAIETQVADKIRAAIRG